ncbi:ubiquitin carboxyl-terminal hydrolase 24-like [Vicia villosa]|uniref:ubiquitin carboxyl-terminal hydrolase 24-like n=1 Tax=Vicia villosa TaxID=3911 RepID=UPI00273BA6AB|nr:ubiquitin carboxyl-terminal hydrolase 24-like [Vicia villosa]
MSNSKVLLFGSFTEDETKLLRVKKSSGRNDKPVEKNQLQFGSLNSVVESSDLPKSPKAPKNVPFPDSQNLVPLPDSQKLNGVNGVSANIPKVSETIKENGSTTKVSSSPSGITSANSVKEHHVPSVTLLHENGTASANHFTNLSLDGSGTECLKSALKNGSSDDTSKLFDEDMKKAPNGHAVMDVKELLPRGLINSGNLCFLSATVQALLVCSPFVQLLQELRTRNIPKVGYPTLKAFAEFVTQFDMPSGIKLKKKDTDSFEFGRAFCPVMFEDVLKNFTPDVPNSISGRPRQEDAQEFLSFVMDQMHDELLKLEGQSSSLNGSKSFLVSSVEDDEWETVGPKNKSAVTRTQSFIPSELNDIFGGQLQSLVRTKGNRSATVQPYRLLHLDIHPDAVHTIEDALHLFSAPETLEGYRTSVTGKARTAKKSIQIQTLPKVMILHLMRFGYGSQGSTKLLKPVYFPLELILGRDLLVSPSTEGRKYELVATITHHGREPSKGHYTADAQYPNGRWLRFDDASVFAIGTNKVLHDQAYVLFYKQI